MVRFLAAIFLFVSRNLFASDKMLRRKPAIIVRRFVGCTDPGTSAATTTTTSTAAATTTTATATTTREIRFVNKSDEPDPIWAMVRNGRSSPTKRDVLLTYRVCHYMLRHVITFG